MSGFSNLYISYNDAKYLLNTEKESIQEIIQTFGEQNKSNIFRDIFSELKGIMCSNNRKYRVCYESFPYFCKSYGIV